ncbi:MAG TPA: hypothetical protein PK185_07755 [Cyclobacteriaceae bacterium]|nr:hypothetical protein [Cyclobacteriaceae bacterium]
MIDLDYYLIIPAETCPFCIKQILLFFDFNQLIQSEKKIRYIVPALSRKKIINTFPQKFRTNSNVTIDTTKYYYQNSIFSDSPQLFYCKNGKVLKKKVLLASDIEKELEALSRNFSKD